MKTTIYKKKLLFLSLILSTFCYSQNTLVSAAGNQKNNSGAVDYVIGQTFFNSVEKTGEGNIHSIYELLYDIIVLGNNDIPIDLKVATYPNPTSDFLNLTFKDSRFLTEKLHYALTDLNGILIKSSKIKDVQSQIDMKNLSTSVYILSIKAKGKILKSFKIIKK